jgi:hypothetical protein
MNYLFWLLHWFFMCVVKISGKSYAEKYDETNEQTCLCCSLLIFNESFDLTI